MTGRTMDERLLNLEKLAETLAPMPARTDQFADRLEDVEGRFEKVEGLLENVQGRLEDVDGRLGTVETQIVLLRADLEVRTTEILHVIDAGSNATQSMFEEVLAAVRSGDEQTRREMRVLHEELVERISRLGEGRRAL